MRALSRYAVTNTVTRAMLSDLLTRQDFDTLLHTDSEKECWTALLKTDFGARLPAQTELNPLSIEQALRTATAQRFKQSIRHLTGRPGIVGALLLSRWELDDLLYALRLWHGKDPELESFLLRSLFAGKFRVAEFIAAQSISDLALALRGTPYRNPLKSAAQRYEESHSIFFVEMALEKNYYERLLAAIHNLGGSDAQIGEKLLGAEIDLLNLSWLSRLVEYQNLTPADLQSALIPAPTRLSQKLVHADLNSESLHELAPQFLTERATRSGQNLSATDRVFLMESLVSEMAVADAATMLASYPFTIGCVFSFYVLSRVELKNLCVVFAGKALNFSAQNISSRMYAMRE